VRVPLGLVERRAGAPVERVAEHQLGHELIHSRVRALGPRSLPVDVVVREPAGRAQGGGNSKGESKGRGGMAGEGRCVR
jgi:hypothetical protein